MYVKFLLCEKFQNFIKKTTKATKLRNYRHFGGNKYFAYLAYVLSEEHMLDFLGQIKKIRVKSKI